MSNLKDKILICKRCNSSQVAIQYGTYEGHPDNYYIECLNCRNWEEGRSTPVKFEVLDDLVFRPNNTNRQEVLDELVTRCTEIVIESMVNSQVFNMNGIEYLVTELRKALSKDYENHLISPDMIRRNK